MNECQWYRASDVDPDTLSHYDGYVIMWWRADAEPQRLVASWSRHCECFITDREYEALTLGELDAVMRLPEINYG